MIKIYCDRCEKEIRKESMSVFEALANAFQRSFITGDKPDFELHMNKNGEDIPLSLCKECKNDLRQFMEKTETYPKRKIIAETEKEVVVNISNENSD